MADNRVGMGLAAVVVMAVILPTVLTPRTALEENAIYDQMVVPITNDDGHPVAYRFWLWLDTRVADTDIGVDDTGEPYVVLAVDGKVIYTTPVLQRRSGLICTITLTDTTLKSVQVGDRRFTSYLLDQDWSRDITRFGNDDKLDATTRLFTYDPPLAESSKVSQTGTVNESYICFASQ